MFADVRIAFRHGNKLRCTAIKGNLHAEFESWTDDEVERLEAHGFRRMSLGPRILRTDTATIALLARLMPEADAFSSTTQGELT